MKLSRTLAGLGVIALAFAACKKDELPPAVVATPEPTTKNFNLFLDYWNPTGTTPQIEFDGDNSSPEVRIDFSDAFYGTHIDDLTNVVIDNVRVIDAQNRNFEINHITAFEWRQNLSGWVEDVEFVMNFTPVEELDVVLVLDASQSLGEGLQNVKTYAKDFAAQVLADIPQARIGIVDFAQYINEMPLTNDIETINAYIDAIEPGIFTSLYDAIHQGLDMLDDSDADGKTLVTFTDGVDNNSDENDPNEVILRLTDNDGETTINSFSIGLGGDGTIDQNVLQAFALNGGVASFPTSLGQLQSTFSNFSNSISTVYNLTYIRNQQTISPQDKAKLKFVINATIK